MSRGGAIVNCRTGTFVESPQASQTGFCPGQDRTEIQDNVFGLACDVPDSEIGDGAKKGAVIAPRGMHGSHVGRRMHDTWAGLASPYGGAIQVERGSTVCVHYRDVVPAGKRHRID